MQASRAAGTALRQSFREIVRNSGQGQDGALKLIEQALAAEAEEAKTAGALGFTGRAIVQSHHAAPTAR